jgi:DNA polymerase-3 subunit delta'
MLFEDIIGNDYVKKYLRKALEKKALGNSLLFSGIDGIGKSLFAKALAVKLMQIPEDDQSSVQRIENETHPDLHVLRPEGKLSLHSISSIRELINKVSLMPFEAKAKVFIILEAHRMLPSSFNALLKTLEEPILDSYIILITGKEQELLPTISSRCTKIKFSPLTDGEIISLLERWGKTSSESKRIASFAQGSISRACEISNFVEDDDITKIVIDILARNNIKNYIDLSQQLDILQSIFDNMDKKENVSYQDISYKFKALDIIFSHIFMWYRDIYLFQNNISADALFFSDKIDLIKKSSAFSVPSLDSVNKYLSEASEAADRNTKIKTCLENLFFKLNIL